MSFPSGTVAMLDVDWLTPAKRRQLTVLGEEGMFELDYLTQRLTFARSTDMSQPRLIGGYAPTFESDVVELRVATGEPLVAELEAFVRVVRDGGPADRGRRRRPLGGRPRGRAAACRPRAPDGRAGARVSPIVRTATAPSLLGDSIHLPSNDCRHGPARHVHPWEAEPGTAGTVAVVGAGKMGLPLAAQFASHGWDVIAVDIDPTVVAAINEGRSHIAEEAGLAELVTEAHAAGRLRATLDGAEAAREADVVVLIVPIILDETSHPDHRSMDAAVAAIAPGVHAGSLVIFETTLPVGDTRGRYAPRLAEASGLTLEEDLFVAFSPERLYSGSALRNLATYPKLVGGLGPASTARAAAFYDSVLDADVVAMSSAETAEFAKLADTTYRDVNIALANEFARYADRIGVDMLEVIAGANSQPYSHIHQPGIGVGGHCIPVYPALPARPGARARPRRPGPTDQRRPGGPGPRRARRCAGRARGPDRPRPRPDLPERGQGAGLFAGEAADRGARRARSEPARLRPIADRRRDGVERRDRVDLGRPRSGRRGDRDPDRGRPLAVDRCRLVPGVAAHRRRPELAPRPGSPGATSAIAASVGIADTPSLTGPRRLLIGALVAILVLLTVYAWVGTILVPGRFAVDLEIPLRAAERWQAGQPPYLASAFTSPPGATQPFLYPPFTLPFLALLTGLPRLFIGTVAVVDHASGRDRGGTSAADTPWIWLPLVLAWLLFGEAIIGANVQMLLFAAFVFLFFRAGGVPWRAPGRDVADPHESAVMVGGLATVVGAVKLSQPHPWVYILRYRPRAAIGAALVMVAIVAATLPLTGIDLWFDYLAQLQRVADPTWTRWVPAGAVRAGRLRAGGGHRLSRRRLVRAA